MCPKKKGIAFDFNNTALQRSITEGIDLNVSLHVLIRIQDQDRFFFFVVGNYITDHPVRGPVSPRFRLALFFEKDYTNVPVIFVHYGQNPFFLNSVQSSFLLSN